MGQKTQMCPFHICGSCVSKDLENHPRSMQWSLPHVPGIHHELRLAREWTWKPVTQHFHCSGRFGKRTVRVWKSWAWLTSACTAMISLCLASAIGKGGEIHLHTHSRCSMYRLLCDGICEICIIYETVKKQDAAHEPECSHVCWRYRCQSTWICSHAHRFSAIVYLNSLVHISPVASLQCGVESAECGV